MAIVIVSGYFDPLHVGHLDMMDEALEYGDHIWVIVNNDRQAELKKRKAFMPEKERLRNLYSL